MRRSYLPGLSFTITNFPPTTFAFTVSLYLIAQARKALSAGITVHRIEPPGMPPSINAESRNKKISSTTTSNRFFIITTFFAVSNKEENQASCHPVHINIVSLLAFQYRSSSFIQCPAALNNLSDSLQCLTRD